MLRQFGEKRLVRKTQCYHAGSTTNASFSQRDNDSSMDNAMRHSYKAQIMTILAVDYLHYGA